MIEVAKYSSEMKQIWDKFIESSKNSHFMFYRDYMEYHADRFTDYSLMFYDEKNRLIAVLPANLNERVIYSHQGLTFGGLLLNSKATTQNVYRLFLKAIDYFKKNHIDAFIYKRMPDFYNTYPSQEDLYALFLLDAKLTRRDVSVAIDLAEPYKYQEMRKRKIKKALKSDLMVSEESSLDEYWNLVTDVLSLNHNAIPVHTLKEIELLRARFPNKIKCFTARLNEELLAGTVIYENKSVVHTQYLANSDKGREIGALDLVIDHLIKKVYKEKKYFDFGISTENSGRTLNEGLIAQKEGFGARAFVHDFYEIKIT